MRWLVGILLMLFALGGLMFVLLGSGFMLASAAKGSTWLYGITWAWIAAAVLAGLLNLVSAIRWLVTGERHILLGYALKSGFIAVSCPYYWLA